LLLREVWVLFRHEFAPVSFVEQVSTARVAAGLERFAVLAEHRAERHIRAHVAGTNPPRDRTWSKCWAWRTSVVIRFACSSHAVGRRQSVETEIRRRSFDDDGASRPVMKMAVVSGFEARLFLTRGRRPERRVVKDSPRSFSPAT
jgi:hypothetical protein